MTGRVIVSETYAGIPNLEVVLYDYDGDETQLIKLMTAIRGLASGDPNAVTLLHNLVTPTHNNPDVSITLDQFHFRLWREILGDRIGSVLTDQNGDFKLTFDRALLKANDKERRPDLILIVLAPEDSNDNENSSILPNPALQRILHFSYEARFDSGRRESYVIRVPKKTLEENSIPVPGQDDQFGLADLAISSMTKSRKAENHLWEAHRQTIKMQLEQAKPLILATQNAFKNYHPSNLPKSVRESKTYFDPLKGGDLMSLLGDIFAENIRVPRTKNPSIRLAFSDEEKNRFVGEGNSEANVEMRHITDKISKMLIGPEAMRGKSLKEIADEMFSIQKKIDEIKAKITSTPDDETNGEREEESSPQTNISPEEYVSERIAALNSKDDSVLKKGQRADENIIKKAVGNFSLTGGPADQVAYHHFQDLQIAFDSVWTEIFDKEVEKSAKKTFENILHYKNKVSGLSEDEIMSEFGSVSSPNDLDDLVTYGDNVLDRVNSGDLPPSQVTDIVPISAEEWNNLTDHEKRQVMKFTYTYNSQPEGLRVSDFVRLTMKNAIQSIISKASKRDTGKANSFGSSSHSNKNSSVTSELRERLIQPYKFDIFQPNSINFGLLIDWQQKWVPLNYQVGELVSTIPLAPKQTKKFKVKQVKKTKTVLKEIQNSISRLKEESEETGRVDSEIVKRAAIKTNFQASASGGAHIGVWNVSGKSQFGMEIEGEAQHKKSQFKESVMKAAKEVKDEHKLEAVSEEVSEFIAESSDMITNPNEEIAVTYLFYELQRRYAISEKLNKITPVILVANEVPSPDEIDEDWLISHDWILKRAILDDSFIQDLDNLKNNVGGNTLNIEFLEKKIEEHKAKISDLEYNVTVKEGDLENAEEELSEYEAEHPGRKKKIQTRREAVERKRQNLEETRSALNFEIDALRKTNEQLIGAVKDKIRKEISRLRIQIHVKQNIFYYVQRILELEPFDQRTLRLYNIEVPWFRPSDRNVRVKVERLPSQMGPERLISKVSSKKHVSDVTLPLPEVARTDEGEIERRKLTDIADLSNPLGFTGNYIIFPLKEINYLSLYMIHEYLDEPLGGLVDPDKFSNYTSEDTLAFVETACNHDKEFFKPEELDEIKEWLTRRKSLNRKELEEITVPSDSLFMECLPGSNPILEDFKLVHIAIDANKALVEKEKSQLEAIRYGAKLLARDYRDPEVDKKILVAKDTGELSTSVDIGLEDDGSEEP